MQLDANASVSRAQGGSRGGPDLSAACAREAAKQAAKSLQAEQPDEVDDEKAAILKLSKLEIKKMKILISLVIYKNLVFQIMGIV